MAMTQHTITGLPNADLYKHFHGDELHEHDGGSIPHNHVMPGKQAGQDKQATGIVKGVSISTLILLAVCIFIGWHVIPAEMSKGSMPPACQLLGGQWDMWNGWQCG